MVNAESTWMLPATVTLKELILVHERKNRKRFSPNVASRPPDATDLHHTILSPGKHKMERIYSNGLIQELPVTTKNLNHDNHKYGPDVLGV